MVEIYPSTLPQPTYRAYAGVINPGLVRSSVPNTLAYQYQGFNSPRIDLSLTFEMDNDTYTQWVIWTQQNGWKWFQMRLVAPRAKDNPIETDQIVRFTTDTQYQKMGDNWGQVTVGAELIPGEE